MMWINVIAAALAVAIAPYLLRIFDQMQQRLSRQNSELRSLHAIDQALNAQLDLNALLDIAVKEATLAVDGERGALWLYEEADPAKTAAQAFYNVPSPAQSSLSEGLGAWEAERVRETGRAQRRAEMESLWAADRVAALLKLRSLICVPVMQQKTLLAVLLVANRGGASPLDGFTDDDETLLLAIAATVAVAIQNARLYQETQRRGEMLRTLMARTGEAVGASSDAPRLMQIFADEASRILGCPRVVIYAQNEPQASLPAELRLLAYHADAPSDAPAPPSLRRPLRADLSPLPADGDAGRHYVPQIRAALGLPDGDAPLLDAPGYVFVLRDRDRRAIGLLCLLDDAPRPPSPDRDGFAQAVAAQASVALENAALSQQTQALLARTQALQAAANQIASELDTERVLEGVMDSARRVLEADGCVLWDFAEGVGDGSGQWASRAAQGMRLSPDVPASRAFEEQILDRALRERSPQTAMPEAAPDGPDMEETEQVRVLLVLPLLYAGEATGAMTLYYHTARALAPDDVGLAQSFAHQVANALQNARLFADLRAAYKREQRIAEVLQRSLLAPIPARAGAFEFAQKYQSALEEAVIGGDFFDFFMLAPDTVGLVMADVSGKGLRAAVQTARVKYTLRGFASEAPDAPGDVLTRVSNVLCSDLGGAAQLEGFVTLFYGVLNTRTGAFCYASAGHEPPLRRDGQTGQVSPIDLNSGLPLGCLSVTEPYPTGTLCFGPGDLLLLYTDGLSEARNPAGAFLGTDGLLAFMPQAEAGAQEAVDTVFDRVSAYTDNHLHDDVALLLLRRPD